QPIVKGRDDRNRARSIAGVSLASRHGFSRVGFSRAGKHGHTSCRLPTHNSYDLPSLVRSESHEFTGRTIRIKAMDTVLNEPIDVPAQFGFVDPAVAVERHHV